MLYLTFVLGEFLINRYWLEFFELWSCIVFVLIGVSKPFTFVMVTNVLRLFLLAVNAFHPVFGWLFVIICIKFQFLRAIFHDNLIA